VAFGRALSDVVDDALARQLGSAGHGGRVGVVAYGSYGRRELCPGSDVDVLLVHDGGGDLASVSEALWYPLWDAGFVLGHGTRTPTETLALAEEDFEVLTGLLDVRCVAGDPPFVRELVDAVRRLCVRRATKVVDTLSDAADERRARFGAVAEMLEPNLKEGEGGLRDVHSLEWAGHTFGGPGGLGALVEVGLLRPEDPARLRAHSDRLLDIRVALHRVTGARTDVLALQEQDAVAAAVGARDADAMMRTLARATREVAWIGTDVMTALRARGLGARAHRVRARALDRRRELGAGVHLLGGRITADPDTVMDAPFVLRLANAAASLDVPIDRRTLERTRELPDVTWSAETRQELIALLGRGRTAVAVFEALEYADVLTTLLPEWEHVRSLPQRNAYHRFTVDRHLLETACECAAILEEASFDGDVARNCAREVLLLGAVLHDIGKGLAGDHSVTGADVAVSIARRLRVDEDGVDAIGWLVRSHLLLADTATRRDLSDEATIARFARAVGGSDRLRLLYVLTIADSRATGPAAWGPAKAALVTELFLKTEGLLERGEVLASTAVERRSRLRELIGADEADRLLDAMPPSYALAFDVDGILDHRKLLGSGRFETRWRDLGDGRIEVAIASPDRTGLLAHVAGALALVGFDIHDAAAYTRGDGRALEIYRGVDRFNRLATDDARFDASETIRRSVAGEIELADRLRDRIERYRSPRRDAHAPQPVSVAVDLEGSDFATIVEVHADDEIGVLARVARTFSDLGLDVSTAKVATIGERVVDVFYVRDGSGGKVTDPGELEALRHALIARLSTDDAGRDAT